MVYRVLTEAYECGVTDLGLYATVEFVKEMRLSSSEYASSSSD